jgi:hypothetical protein
LAGVLLEEDFSTVDTCVVDTTLHMSAMFAADVDEQDEAIPGTGERVKVVGDETTSTAIER